ncbi:MAG: lytic transglycosylase domain-containing protein, partial [Bacteroidales bacterium]|nr:lytic transglycosylase domain-containing protein [Bacteroidales bacterium]
EVACQYILNAYEKYGSWTLAAASYNAGMNGITKNLKMQKAETYYDMNLGEETGRYVYRIVALKELLSRPEDFGFKLRAKDLYRPYDTYEITVDTTIHSLGDFAALYGMNYKELKIYNPWLRQTSMPDKSRKQYQIKIPKEN